MTEPVSEDINPTYCTGGEADRSPPFSAKGKHAWRCTSTPHTSSLHVLS